MSEQKQPESNAQPAWQEREARLRSDIYQAGKNWNRGSVPVADLLPKIVDPICARKGLASSALLAAWKDIVGTNFADCTIPEKVQWPHQHGDGAPSYQGGVMVVRVDGPRAIYLQHEEQQIIQRLNQFFGFMAIDRLKIVQAPIDRRAQRKKTDLPTLSLQQEKKLREVVTEFDNPELDDAVLKLGRGVLQRELLRRK